MGIKTNVLTMFTACLIARPARRECSCSDDDLREIQMPGVWRVVRGNLGAIPGTRTWQTELGSLLISPSLRSQLQPRALGTAH